MVDVWLGLGVGCYGWMIVFVGWLGLVELVVGCLLLVDFR